MMRRGLILIGLVCLASTVWPVGTLRAQEKTAAPDTAAVSPEAELEKKADKVRIFLDKIEILGRIEKPQTVFIIPGRDPSVDDIHIDRSFFKEIFRSVEKDRISKRNRRRRR